MSNESHSSPALGPVLATLIPALLCPSKVLYLSALCQGYYVNSDPNVRHTGSSHHHLLPFGLDMAPPLVLLAICSRNVSLPRSTSTQVFLLLLDRDWDSFNCLALDWRALCFFLLLRRQCRTEGEEHRLGVRYLHTLALLCSHSYLASLSSSFPSLKSVSCTEL